MDLHRAFEHEITGEIRREIHAELLQMFGRLSSRHSATSVEFAAAWYLELLEAMSATLLYCYGVNAESAGIDLVRKINTVAHDFARVNS